MGKVLVTGATGFTGWNLSRRLIQEGEQLVAFVRPTSQINNLLDLGVECRQVDIKNRRSVFNNFEGWSI